VGSGDGNAVAVRAFRGTNKASVYRDHVLPERVFERILAAGRDSGLALLSSLGRGGPHRLDKGTARELVRETQAIRTGGALHDLDDDLLELAAVARWCSRASGNAWLKIEEA
jgi:hypothetical protein